MMENQLTTVGTDESNAFSEPAFNALLEEIRQAFGRVVYTHKAQEKCADHKLQHFNVIRFTQTILSAITSTGFLAIVLGKPEIHQISAIAGGIASLLLTAINLYSQGRNTMGEVDKHTTTASKLWLAREQYQSLITDIVSRTISIEEVKKLRSSLQSELAEIYSTAPRTDDKAYKAAQAGLKNNEEFTFSDEEIDVFLPIALRKGVRNEAQH